MNPNDPQYQIAEDIFNDLVDNLYQWCPQSDIDALDEIADMAATENETSENIGARRLHTIMEILLEDISIL